MCVFFFLHGENKAEEKKIFLVNTEVCMRVFSGQDIKSDVLCFNMNPHLTSLYSVSGILTYSLNLHLNLGHDGETIQR